MTKKPRWWWRMLACLPYLMPFNETLMFLHPLLEDFEFLTYPFLGAIGRLPSWFLMAYFFVAYLGIVRRKEWSHFFRSHVVMGMLLEIAIQVVVTVRCWMPLALCPGVRLGCISGSRLHLPLSSRYWSASDVVIAGGTAGVVVETALYPIGTIKTRLKAGCLWRW